MNIQENLLYITELELKRLNSNKIRGVTAYWNDNTACLSFYFDGAISDEDIENASEVCTYIIAHFSNGLLEENYIRLDYPKPLPEEFLAYKRDE
jgi:hypothetical protein